MPKSSKRKGKGREDPVSPAVSLKLFCVVHPSSRPFPVELGNDRTVGDLKKAIKFENPHRLDDIDAAELTLYKVSILAKNVAQTLRALRFDGSDDRVEELDAMDLSVDVFPNGAEKGHLHIVATRPGTCCIPSDPCDFTYGLTKRPMTWENVSIRHPLGNHRVSSFNIRSSLTNTNSSNKLSPK